MATNKNEGKKSISMQDRLKLFSNQNTKKDEKPVEKIKITENKETPNKEEKEKEKEKPKIEKPKSTNPFADKYNKSHSNPLIQKEPKEDTTKRLSQTKMDQSKFGGAFASRLNQMNEMFKKQAQGGGYKHRFSAVVPTGKYGIGIQKDARGDWRNSNSNNLGIISEEPDKMKAGYDPSANLRKTLDSVVVVQKNKKKKKKPSTFSG